MTYRSYVKIYLWIHIPLLFLFSLFLMLDARNVFDAVFVCSVETLLHLYCPLCGGTRALWLLLSGNVLRSLVYNPTTLCLVAAVVYYEILAVLSLATRELSYIKKARLFPLIAVGAVCVAYCVLRNVLLVTGSWDGIGELLPFWT